MPPVARRVERDYQPLVTGMAPMRPSPTAATRTVPKITVPSVPTAPVPRSAEPKARRRWVPR